MVEHDTSLGEQSGFTNLHSYMKPKNTIQRHLSELTSRWKYEVDNNNINTTMVNFHITATA